MKILPVEDINMKKERILKLIEQSVAKQDFMHANIRSMCLVIIRLMRAFFMK